MSPSQSHSQSPAGFCSAVFLRSILARSLLGALVCASGGLQAQSLRVEPARPSGCDDLVLVATRFTSSDCNWSVRTHATRVFERRFDIELELIPGSEICLPVALEETFRVPLGSFPPGEWQLSFSWVDGHPVDLRSLLVTVAEGDCGPGFHHADANGDGRIDIADPVAALNFLFLGGELPCVAAADANSSDSIEISDAIFTLAFLFSGGPSPMPSPTICAPLPADGALSCETPSCRAALAPDATVWIAKPDGCLQCDDCAAREIPGEAVASMLRDEGFVILDATEAFIGVCEACSCPSGRYWVLRVPASELDDLRERGWEIWGDGQPLLE